MQTSFTASVISFICLCLQCCRKRLECVMCVLVRLDIHEIILKFKISNNFYFFCCIAITCDAPREIEHVHLNLPLTEFQYNDSMNYTCDRGWWFQRGLLDLEIRCNETGFWKPNPLEYSCSGKKKFIRGFSI